MIEYKIMNDRVCNLYQNSIEGWREIFGYVHDLKIPIEHISGCTIAYFNSEEDLLVFKIRFGV